MRSSTPPDTLRRAFVAALPDHHGRQALAELRGALQQAMPAQTRGWLADFDLHLTLRFLGDLTPADAGLWCGMLTTHAGGESIALAFEHLEYWPLRSPKLAVARFENTPRLNALANQSEQMARSQGLAEETRGYVPHVTLLRASRRLAEPPAVKLAPVTVRFDRIALMMRSASTQGTERRYAVHAEWQLPTPSAQLLAE